MSHFNLEGKEHIDEIEFLQMYDALSALILQERRVPIQSTHNLKIEKTVCELFCLLD